MSASISSSRRLVLQRRIRLIVAATITWNVLEAIIAISAGAAASSAALVGFGLDSVVEVLSAAAVAWQFAAKDPAQREAKALRLIAWSFFLLATYVTGQALVALITGERAEHSTVGIALAIASVIIMPLISTLERNTGRQLSSSTAVADSKQTMLCAYLSAVVLGGLVLNSLLGWWWADSIAAFVIAGVAVREGLEAWRGETCSCTSGIAQLSGAKEDCSDGCCESTTTACCSENDCCS